MPSTCARSSLSWSNARRVNSPGSARRNPCCTDSAASVAAMTAGPPCRCSSATSSPVKECGAGNHSTSASSIGSSSLPTRRRSVATRGFGSARSVSAASAARASASGDAHHRHARAPGRRRQCVDGVCAGHDARRFSARISGLAPASSTLHTIRDSSPHTPPSPRKGSGVHGWAWRQADERTFRLAAALGRCDSWRGAFGVSAYCSKSAGQRAIGILGAASAGETRRPIFAPTRVVSRLREIGPARSRPGRSHGHSAMRHPGALAMRRAADATHRSSRARSVARPRTRNAAGQRRSTRRSVHVARVAAACFRVHRCTPLAARGPAALPRPGCSSRRPAPRRTRRRDGSSRPLVGLVRRDRAPDGTKRGIQERRPTRIPRQPLRLLGMYRREMHRGLPDSAYGSRAGSNPRVSVRR